MTLQVVPNDLLLIADVQRDFCEGGALPVHDGGAVVAPINALMDRFANIVAVQDWHPLGHASFASSYPARAPFDRVELGYGAQTLWPDHCVQGTSGAELHPELRREPLQLVLRKGFRPEIDSYSAFLENDRKTPTGLAGYLRERGIARVVCVGLALDYCVRWSAEDAWRLGFGAAVVANACRAIGAGPAVAETLDTMRLGGIEIVGTGDIVGGAGS